MNRWLTPAIVTILCMLCLWPATQVEAQLAQGLVIRPGEEVTLRSDNIQYFRTVDIYVATGDVRLHYGDNVLTADEIVLDRTVGTFTASGNVTLTDGRSRLSSEYAVVRIDDRTGVIFEGSFFLPESGYRMTGRRIERLGDVDYLIEDGTLTTCDCGPDATPSWHISASRIRVTLGGYAQVTHAMFYVRGVPVFYLPFGFFPVKQDREFGLLFPNLSYSGIHGFEVNQGLFIPLGDSADATIWLDYYSARGYGATGEFRYVAERDSYGTTRFQWMRQAFLDEADPGYQNQRYIFRSTHRHNLGEHEAFVGDINTVSDRAYSAELGRTLEEQSRQFSRSRVGYIRSGERFSLLGRAEVTERQQRSNLPDFSRLPQVQLLAWPQRLFDGGPILTGTATAERFVSKDANTALWNFDAYSTVGDRFDLMGRLEQPVVSGPLLTTPFLSLRQTLHRPVDDQSTAHRSMLTAGASFQAPFEAHYTYGPDATESAGPGALLHQVSPVGRYLFTPDWQPDVPFEVDELDIIRSRNLLEYGVENRLMWLGRDARRTGYAELGVYQHYSFAATDSAPRSPYLARLRLQLPRGIRVQAEQYYDEQREVSPFYRTSARLSGRLPGNLMTGLEFHSYRNYEVTDRTRVLVDELIDNEYRLYGQATPWASREVWLSLSRRFFNHIGLAYSGRYSIDREQMIESIYGASYLSRCDCWSVRGNFIQRPNQDFSFNLTFTLVGLGSLGTD